LKFEELKVGQTFKSSIRIDKDEFEKYLSFAKTKNILHENPELAAKEGIKDITLLPGRAIVAHVEGEMTHLNVFSNSIMLLYGMDGDPWGNRHTRFLSEVYAGEELEVEYSISDKKDGELSELYGILSIDVKIKRIIDNKLVIVSHRNLYRIKK